jgi:SAM-dependent methyltransferase
VQEEGVSTKALTLCRADVAALPLRPTSIDAMHAGAAMHCWPRLEEGLRQIRQVLRPGGLFVIECLAPAHASLGTAEHGKMWSRTGPDAALLVGAAELVADFQGVLEMVRCEEVARRVDEGRFHRGPAIVTQLVGRRPGGGGSPTASALPPTPPSFPPNVRPPTIEVAPPPPLPFRASMDRLVGAVAAAGPGAETALESARRRRGGTAGNGGGGRRRG